MKRAARNRQARRLGHGDAVEIIGDATGARGLIGGRFIMGAAMVAHGLARVTVHDGSSREVPAAWVRDAIVAAWDVAAKRAGFAGMSVVAEDGSTLPGRQPDGEAMGSAWEDHRRLWFEEHAA